MSDRWHVQAASGVVRTAAMAVVGVVMATACSLTTEWSLAAVTLVGWDAAAVTFLAWVACSVRGADATATKRLALTADEGLPAADVLVLLAAVASLFDVASLFAGDTSAHDPVVVAAAAVFTVFTSWALVHTIFLLRYARIYYGEPEGGIDFPGGDAPDYRDFAYVAFTVGMCYQVSDTALTSRPMRATATRHGVLSFLFGVVIVATTINLVAGLVG